MMASRSAASTYRSSEVQGSYGRSSLHLLTAAYGPKLSIEEPEAASVAGGKADQSLRGQTLPSLTRSGHLICPGGRQGAYGCRSFLSGPALVDGRDTAVELGRQTRDRADWSADIDRRTRLGPLKDAG